MLALIYQHQPDPSWVWDMETYRNISKVMIFPAKDVTKCTFADPNLIALFASKWDRSAAPDFLTSGNFKCGEVSTFEDQPLHHHCPRIGG